MTEKGQPVKEVAERLGMSTYSLYEWIKKHGRANGAQASRLANANKDDEIRRLGSELKRVTEERNILRKAAVMPTPKHPGKVRVRSRSSWGVSGSDDVSRSPGAA